jgi:hypothetical protein
MKIDLWYRELVYYQEGVTFELRSRINGRVERDTPVLTGLRPVSSFMEPVRCSKRKVVRESESDSEGDELVYEPDEGESDDRLDGAYWRVSSTKRRRK